MLDDVEVDVSDEDGLLVLELLVLLLGVVLVSVELDEVEPLADPLALTLSELELLVLGVE